MSRCSTLVEHMTCDQEIVGSNPELLSSLGQMTFDQMTFDQLKLGQK